MSAPLGRPSPSFSRTLSTPAVALTRVCQSRRQLLALSSKRTASLLPALFTPSSQFHFLTRQWHSLSLVLLLARSLYPGHNRRSVLRLQLMVALQSCRGASSVYLFLLSTIPLAVSAYVSNFPCWHVPSRGTIFFFSFLIFSWLPVEGQQTLNKSTFGRCFLFLSQSRAGGLTVVQRSQRQFVSWRDVLKNQLWKTDDVIHSSSLYMPQNYKSI